MWSLSGSVPGYCLIAFCCLALLLIACNQDSPASSSDQVPSTSSTRGGVNDGVRPESNTGTTVDNAVDPTETPAVENATPLPAKPVPATTTPAQSLRQEGDSEEGTALDPDSSDSSGELDDGRDDEADNALAPSPTAASSIVVPINTLEPLILVPTDTPAPLILHPTNTPLPQPMAHAINAMNVRDGPGTEYPVIGTLAANTQVQIIGSSPALDWWQVRLPDQREGWVYAALVETSGDTTNIAVVADILLPPPTATPAPVVEQPEPGLEGSPTESLPQESTPTAEGPDFRVIEKRLWDVYENGGRLDGPTVICGEKRQLVVNVVDASGSRINGVAVQAQYGNKEIFVTGAQGKGDGVVEFILGRGQDVKVIRDVDGSAATSEVATGLSTEPAAIPYEYLIAGQYCTDEESCSSFVAAPGCWGHYSWTVTFQRNY